MGGVVRSPGIVDFAHNALSVRNLLGVLRSYYNGRIICVLSCTDSLRMRRAPVGETVGELADLTVITSFTSERTQSEDVFEDILEGMKKTSGRYTVIADRRDAIKYALSVAEHDDVVVINAKGTYRDNKFDENWLAMPDDFDLLREIFRSM